MTSNKSLFLSKGYFINIRFEYLITVIDFYATVNLTFGGGCTKVDSCAI